MSSSQFSRRFHCHMWGFPGTVFHGKCCQPPGWGVAVISGSSGLRSTIPFVASAAKKVIMSIACHVQMLKRRNHQGCQRGALGRLLNTFQGFQKAWRLCNPWYMSLTTGQCIDKRLVKAKFERKWIRRRKAFTLPKESKEERIG